MRYYQILRFPHAFSYFYDKNKQERGIWLSHYLWLSAPLRALREIFF